MKVERAHANVTILTGHLYQKLGKKCEIGRGHFGSPGGSTSSGVCCITTLASLPPRQVLDLSIAKRLNKGLLRTMNNLGNFVIDHNHRAINAGHFISGKSNSTVDAGRSVISAGHRRILTLSSTLCVAFKFCAEAIRASSSANLSSFFSASSIPVLPIRFFIHFSELHSVNCRMLVYELLTRSALLDRNTENRENLK